MKTQEVLSGVAEAEDRELDLLCVIDDWGWEEDDFPPIEATPLRVSFLEAAKFAPVQEKK